MGRFENMLIKASCAPDFLKHKLFPNWKEFTESMGMYQCVKNVLGKNRLGENLTLVSVGDGHTPRTAALFAFMSRWNCYSIDPNMRQKKGWGEIGRLTPIQRKIEDFHLHVGGDLVIVGVHAHISLRETLKNLTCGGKRHLFYMPCCFEADLTNPPTQTIVESEIKSPKNTIQIWENI